MYPDAPTVGDVVAFGDAQTAKLDEANSRTADTIDIVEKCEDRDKATVVKLQPKKWWQFWSR